MQCVTQSLRCDNVRDCKDGYDEYRCEPPDTWERRIRRLPMFIDFLRRGHVVREYMGPSEEYLEMGYEDTGMTCPETHFWCLDKDFCLPVFLRCNDIYDCPGHEDEEGCGVYTCPGFYHCRASKVCVHVTHVCDGMPLCPQNDDELLCGQQCPPQCSCQGLAFFCNQVFAAHDFPDLRYLDARGSGMSVDRLGDNYMLIHLSLAWCGVRVVSNFTFQNLYSLDLSDNLLTEVSVHHFSRMPQLKILFLAGNNLTSVFKNPSDSSTKVLRLSTLDLSRVKLYSVETSLITVSTNLHSLNLSHTRLELLQWSSSQASVAPIKELDLRGCVVAEFPRDALRGFFNLQILFTDNFKLCCPSVLPPEFDLSYCHVTPDDVSSCDHLLGTIRHHTAVAILATLALLGNTVSLTLRVCIGGTLRLSNSDAVLTQLSVADLGTGLYLATLGFADRLLAGHYVWHDNAWRRGTVCHLAGFLALTCRLAATFFITILSLDRCLFKCPTLTAIVSLAKIKFMSVVVWVLSLVLALVPLMRQWQFYGQNALCIPELHKRTNSLESSYTHGLTVLLHFVMFVLCSLFEVVHSVSGRVKPSCAVGPDARLNDSRFAVWGFLSSGFLYTITCLAPTDARSENQRAIRTTLVYLGFVVSCAMNPYLHLYGVRVERSKRIKEERLLRIVNRTRV